MTQDPAAGAAPSGDDGARPGAAAADRAGAAAAPLPVTAPEGSAPVLLAPASRQDGAGPGWLARLGLAVIHPRWALAIAGDRRNVGRSGSDLIAAIVVLLLATQLRGLATAVWLATSVAPGFGVRAAMRVVTGTLTIDLGLLLLGALVLFALSGARRNLGRAFDLACVAVLPLVLIDLAATVVVRVAGIAAVPASIGWLLTGLSYAWMGALIALSLRPARSAARVPAPPASVERPARRIGAGIAALAAIGVAVQVVWISDHLELIKPMTAGSQAPALALPRIEKGGKLGEVVTLESMRGKITVLDFWATWCGPCLAAMPKVDRLARSHPDIAVIAINLDDPAAARALFDKHGYAMTLVADDGDVNQRYGASAIPYTVIVDGHGVVREVVQGAGEDLAAIIESIRASE